MKPGEIIEPDAATGSEHPGAAAIRLPDPSLVLLVGAAGSGKTTLARRCFDADEVISSDRLRELLSGDEANQAVSGAAFQILHERVAGRLAAGRLTVVDATNVEPHARRALLELARAAGTPAVAIVLDIGIRACLDQNGQRPGRSVEPAVIERQADALRRSLAGEGLAGEGFAAIHRLETPGEIAAVAIAREGGPQR